MQDTFTNNTAADIEDASTASRRISRSTSMIEHAFTKVHHHGIEAQAEQVEVTLRAPN